MLTNLRFADFRGFHDLSVGKLARVNLFVGTNNAGKTSLLEGAELLLSGGNLRSVVRDAQRRGEFILPTSEEAEIEIDLCHLFHGHHATEGARLGIRGEENGQPRHVEMAIAKVAPEDKQLKRLKWPPSWEELSDTDAGAGPPLALEIQSDRFVQSTLIPLSPSGGVSTLLTRRYATPEVETPVIHFIGTETLDPSKLSRLWDAIVLTPAEPLVVEALQIVEPGISRIASTSNSVSARGSSSSFFIKMVDSDQRIPLGSMGDGVKRLIALSMHLVRSAGGYLLVDEIDTGLHHSVMVDMWRLVVETARRLDLQVFATTHSLDCVNALGSLFAEAPSLADEVLLHRIKRNGTATVPYSPEEVLVAAEHQMEIR